MAVAPEDIQKLEEAMRFFGIEGITVDGDASDLLTKIAPFLEKFAGDSGAFSQADLLNSETRDARIAEIAESVEGLKDSPQLGLVREVLSPQPNYQNIEQHLGAIGVPGAGFLVPQLKNLLENGTTPHDLLHGGPTNTFGKGVLELAKDLPSFKAFKEMLGDNAMANVEQTLSLIDNADTWFDVIEEIKPDIPEDSDAAAQLAEANEAAQAVAEAEAAAAKLERIKGVEQAIGIENPDGVWGEAEQDALRGHIQTLQNGEQNSAWEGAKNGFYDKDFAEYAIGNLSGFNPQEKLFFEQLLALEGDGVDLVDENDLPINSEEVKTSIVAIEKMLVALTPYVQEQLDAEKAKAEALIESIEGGRASELQIQAATKVLNDPNASEDDRVEAQSYLDRSGLSDNIGEFIDGFLLLDQHDWGSQLVEKGKSWSIDMIRGRLDSYNDLPSVDSFTLNDGRLDIHEQTALQGVLFLMADKLGVPGQDNWQYTPELGEAIIAKLPSLPLEQKEELIGLVPLIALPAGYAEMSAEEKNAALNSEITKGVGLFVDQMNIADRAGVLTEARLYLSEELEIPALTKEIFTEFINGNRDEMNAHYHRDAATPIERNMLNLMMHEFTEGLDLADLMGEGFDPLETDIFGTDADAIAARFAEMYRQDIDLEEMGKMVETMPFGSDTRRQMFRELLEKMEKEEAEGTTVAVLATMFGEGMVEINNHADGGSDYLYRTQRSITVDPRLNDFSLQVGGETLNADDLYSLHKADQNDFKVDGPPYTPSYFKDENGDVYVAGLDVVSRVFQVEKLDLDGWRQVLADNPQRPGESITDHVMRLDEKLQDVSGYNIIFQNMSDPNLRATFAGSVTTFPSAAFENGIPSLGAFKGRVGGMIAEQEAEAQRAALKAATPGNSSVLEEFKASANSGTSEPEDRAPSLDKFSQNPVDRTINGAGNVSELNKDGASGPAMQSSNQGQ